MPSWHYQSPTGSAPDHTPDSDGGECRKGSGKGVSSGRDGSSEGWCPCLYAPAPQHPLARPYNKGAFSAKMFVLRIHIHAPVGWDAIHKYSVG